MKKNFINSIFIFLIIVIVMNGSLAISGVSYIRANNQILGQVEFDNNVKFFQLDFLKNVRTVFNESGTPSAFQDFAPFGESDLQSISSLNYRSGLVDVDSELYGSYDPSIGRSISTHSAYILTHTQGLNPYSSFLNNPFRNVLTNFITFNIDIPEAPAGVTGSHAGAAVASNLASRVARNVMGKTINAENARKARSAKVAGVISGVTNMVVGIKNLADLLATESTMPEIESSSESDPMGDDCVGAGCDGVVEFEKSPDIVDLDQPDAFEIIEKEANKAPEQIALTESIAADTNKPLQKKIIKNTKIATTTPVVSPPTDYLAMWGWGGVSTFTTTSSSTSSSTSSAVSFPGGYKGGPRIGGMAID
jgi:hypothetical protein